MAATELTTSTAWEWQATGTRWRIHHAGHVSADAARAVAGAVEADEARWSRFRPGSEVSAISRLAGTAVAVAPETLELLAACEHWRIATCGVFQPLVGSALTRLGYAAAMQTARPFAEATPAAGPVGGRIELDERRGRARIPAGCALDLGGIAKTWIARRAAVLLAAADGPVLLDAGGDLLAVSGTHLVALERPPGCHGHEPLARLELHEGEALATSGWAARSWVNGDGSTAHHLVDPATGLPGGRTHATVLADDAVRADVEAKWLALRPDRLGSCGLAARVSVEGQPAATASWRTRLVA